MLTGVEAVFGATSRWIMLCDDKRTLLRKQSFRGVAAKRAPARTGLGTAAGARQAGGFDTMIGVSAPLQRLLHDIAQVAASDITVLLLGETGTGKELAARALHEHNRRANRPIVAVNCAALPEHLIESEMFGYERGAFTGAKRQGLKPTTLHANKMKKLGVQREVVMVRRS